jgi:hypothetical protein
MVAVTFEVVSLRTNTLSEPVFPLLKTFMELLFWNALQDGHHMSLNVDKVGPSKWSSVFGIAKSHMEPNLVNVAQFQYRFFGQKLQDSKHVMSRGIVMMQDPSIRPKFRSSLTNSLT